MIIPHSRLYVQADGYKSGANGTFNVVVSLGSTNSASDATIVNQVVGSGTGTSSLSTCAARFGTATDRFNARTGNGEVASSASSNQLSDRQVNINTNADMYVNVGVAAANSSDTFNLVTLQVALEA